MKQADIREAGPLASAFLYMWGFAGIVSPWRTIYIHPEFWGADWLERHEVAHLGQMERDGWLRFWVKCIFGFLYFGYERSPIEIEAREAEWNVNHPLLEGWDVPRW